MIELQNEWCEQSEFHLFDQIFLFNLFVHCLSFSELLMTIFHRDLTGLGLTVEIGFDTSNLDNLSLLDRIRVRGQEHILQIDVALQSLHFLIA